MGMHSPRTFSDFQIHTVASVLMAMMLLTACGRANTIYAADDNGVVTIDDPVTALPAGFESQSINSSYVGGIVWSHGAQIDMAVYDDSRAAGAYRDPALTGNRAILSIFKYDSTPLDGLTLSFEKESSATAVLRLTALVDLQCDGTSPLRTFRTDSLATSVSIDDTVWSVSGTAITDSTSTTLVYSTNDATRTSLKNFLEAYPNACLRNGVSDADDAPAAATAMGALQLSIGNAHAVANENQSVTLENLKVNADIYATWATGSRN